MMSSVLRPGPPRPRSAANRLTGGTTGLYQYDPAIMGQFERDSIAGYDSETVADRLGDRDLR
jgi:hypothetical protein